MSAVLTMAVGMLLIDISALQENMVCTTDYSNASKCPEVFFAQSYHAARMKFKEAAQEAGAAWEQHSVLQEDGFDYTVDTAFVRGKRSKNLLVHMSGARGVDGFTGSAVQVKLLREWNSSREDGPSVLFVHAVNPYGMAHFRTCNEENVDLGSNYLSPKDWEGVLALNPNSSGYDEVLESLQMSRAPRFIDRYMFLFRLVKGIATKGLGVLKQTLSTGQYHRSDAVGFGGHGEQRAITVLREILKSQSITGIEKSILLDVRTGPGKEGAETIVPSSREDAAIATTIFTGAKVVSNNGGAESTGDIVPRDILGENSLTFKETFGTMRWLFVVRALFLENAACNYAKGSHTHAVMQEWVRDAFYPQTMSYKNAVLKKGVIAFNCAWRHLSEA
ncbi:uncharacterized protein Tco025E_01806 [Trypanosoma conorhini]|uniref:DUF2817 domain-containing protein n=1 Tax=Trypanosoma conorhini TaxID=83891 RepID=A0A3R7PVS6_9TRYP|nr:uncharacterized protein Tco025E_01806 [Trypanosoma conorhini]RNF25920.1 hypothetical protein Tco025E_01806 [Trypanosoma conorhini]